MATDIASSLGIGSGINTTQMVADLTSASFQPKEDAINARVSTNNARISALASAKSALDTFSTALTELLKSSDYKGQPVSNDPSIAAVSLIDGGVPTGLPAQIEVQQLATAQVMQAAALTAPTAVAGTGSMTLTVGATTKTITLTSPANTLADLAGAINSSGAGVTASIVQDQSGARLVLKGQTGTDKTFSLTANGDADADLQRFASTNMTQTQAAQNALIKIDNVPMEFTSNEVTTAIPYVRIDLNKAAPGTTVTLATDQPTSSMSDLVQDFVTAYNNLKSALNTATATSTDGTTTGTLSADSGIREMSRRLAALTSTPLATSGTYRTLSDLGVSTQRDGTLAVDTTRLTAALAADPEGITQMLNPTVASADNPGIAGALKSVTDYLNATDGPLASSKSIYDKLQESLQTQLDKLDTDRTNYSDRMTKSFATMQTQLLQFKATQSYLTQQIAAWNNSDS